MTLRSVNWNDFRLAILIHTPFVNGNPISNKMISSTRWSIILMNATQRTMNKQENSVKFCRLIESAHINWFIKTSKNTQLIAPSKYVFVEKYDLKCDTTTVLHICSAPIKLAGWSSCGHSFQSTPCYFWFAAQFWS